MVTDSDRKRPPGRAVIRLSEHHYPSAYAHTLLARCFSSTMPAPQRRQPSTTAATAHAPPLLWAQFFLKEGSHLRRLQLAQPFDRSHPAVSSKKAAIYDGGNLPGGAEQL